MTSVVSLHFHLVNLSNINLQRIKACCLVLFSILKGLRSGPSHVHFFHLIVSSYCWFKIFLFPIEGVMSDLINRACSLIYLYLSIMVIWYGLMSKNVGKLMGGSLGCIL